MARTTSNRLQSVLSEGRFEVLRKRGICSRYLTTGIIVDAEPVTDPPELMRLMRLKGFGAFENGALVRSWELVLPDEELEALLNEG